MKKDTMKFHDLQRGIAAVELALLLIPLAILTFGVTEYGRAVYQYNMLIKGTRDATRFLSGQGPGDPADVTTAQCLAVYGNRTCTGDPLVPNLTAAMVTVCDRTSCPATHLNVSTGTGVVNLVTVTTAGYTFTFIAPVNFQSGTYFQNMVFGPISTTMRQVL